MSRRSKFHKFKNLADFDTGQVKALFGFHPLVLAEILLRVLPELEERRKTRLATRVERKRPFAEKDGKPRTVTPLIKVLMSLLYLRHNVSHTVVGAMFGCSADSSENAFVEVLPVLRDLFPKEKWAAEKRHRGAEAQWQPEQIDRIIIDSFETPVRRPSLSARQKRLFSGKKGQTTLKTQLVSDGASDVLDVDAGQRGPAAASQLYRGSKLAETLPAELKDKPRYGDKAYADQKQPEITTPKKKPKGGELTPAEKEQNKEISRKRIAVEHSIRRVKGFRLLRDQYRLPIGIFPTVASAVVGLIHFSNCLS